MRIWIPGQTDWQHPGTPFRQLAQLCVTRRAARFIACFGGAVRRIRRRCGGKRSGGECYRGGGILTVGDALVTTVLISIR